jgi:hypothetical protein
VRDEVGDEGLQRWHTRADDGEIELNGAAGASNI